jgi:Bacteriophage protein gp37
MAKRLQAMRVPNYENGFKVTLHEDSLRLPYEWKQPQAVFVNSMSDLFHEDVPFEFIEKVFNVMNDANWHTYQVLTKRSNRLLELDIALPWASNIWMGVTVESIEYINRIVDLQNSIAQVKFLSLEPLLGPLPNLDLQKIDWVITGGESGPGARPIEKEWVEDIRDQCIKTAFHFSLNNGVE